MSDKNLPIGKFPAITFPANEAQIRPLVNSLKTDGERLHVWAEVVKQATQDAENASVKVGSKKPASPQSKITADLVQRKVDRAPRVCAKHQHIRELTAPNFIASP